MTGMRVEELTELSHHSLVQYRLPATGELMPLLQIAPSKTDTGAVCWSAPELADVLTAIVCRIRNPDGVPLVVAYDHPRSSGTRRCRCCSSARIGNGDRPITYCGIRELLIDALARTGLTDVPAGP